MENSFRAHTPSDSGTISSQMRSQRIPISSTHLNPSASELQLCLDEEIAEQRDHLFYSRVVRGIQQSQLAGKDYDLQMQNQLCLAHIMQAHGDSTQKTHYPKYPGFLGAPIEDPEEEDWAVGMPIDSACPTLSYYPTRTSPTRRDFHSIATHAIELVNSAEEEGMIFDMDL